MHARHLIRRLVAAIAVVSVLTGPAAALGLIRDAEIERTLGRMTSPLLKAAGLPPSSVTLYIVNSSALNAFVAGGRNMFLNTGLIATLETPEELLGVIAHEAGHIAGGHEARRAIGLRDAQGPALLGMLVAIAAGVAGGGEAAAAISAGTQQLIARRFLSHNRGEEASADQAAIRYLEAAGVDPRGLLKVLERFRGQEVFTLGNTDPYVLTHPLSTERMQLLERHLADAGEVAGLDEETLYWHARMRAKLTGFLDRPDRVLDRIEDEPETEITLYKKAIALHRLPDPAAAVATADRLIAMRPGDPFYLELKGQILHESGRAAQAVPLYRAAVEAAPDEPLLKAGLGRALLALETPEADAEALAVLEDARTSDRADPAALRDLATAYGRAGETGMATLATAERYALAGRNDDAVLHARRAIALLPEGTPAWLRANDILVLERAEN